MDEKSLDYDRTQPPYLLKQLKNSSEKFKKKQIKQMQKETEKLQKKEKLKQKSDP